MRRICQKLSVITLLVVVFCISLLSACTSVSVNQVTALQIDGMLIENQTLMHVTAVRLLVPVTGNFVSCGNIAPNSMCSTTFPETAYTGNPVEITWSQDGQIFSTGEFVLEIPAGLDENQPALVQIVIAGRGSAGALIIQRSD